MRFLVTLTCAATLLSALAQAQLLEPAPQTEQPQQRAQLIAHMKEQEQAGADTSSDPEARKAYVETLRALGYHDLAAEQMTWFTGRYPESPEHWRALGESWIKAGPAFCEPAFDALQRALSLDGDDLESMALLAHLTHREGLYDQAAGYYDTILRRDPGHVRATLGKAVLEARSGDILSASARIDALGPAAQPYDTETRIMLRKALFDFERRGGWFDDSGPNHAAYARLLYRAGRVTGAVLAARRAVTLNPGDYAAWNFIALIQLQLGNVEQAEQAYAKSLDANPDQPQIDTARKQLIQELTLRDGAKIP